MIENELPESFWTGMLPQLMDTSSVESPYFLAYQAAQVKLGDKGFLSRDITVLDLLMNRSDVHHVYPRKHLKTQGLSRGRYNQIANFVLAQSEINIAIGDKPPEKYFKELAEQCDGGKKKYGGITDAAELRANLRMSCLPESLLDGEIPDYDDFLEERRKLMALKIKTWFEALWTRGPAKPPLHCARSLPFRVEGSDVVGHADGTVPRLSVEPNGQVPERGKGVVVTLATMVILSVMLVASPAAFAQDPSSCASALEDLSSEAEEAKVEADDAEQECEQSESDCDEYRSCRAFPDIYDLLGDGCLSNRMDCEMSKQTCESFGVLDDVGSEPAWAHGLICSVRLWGSS